MGSHRLALALALLLASGAVLADALRVGVVTSQLGSAAFQGEAQARAARAYAASLRARGGVFGTPIELLLRDDAGDPARALELARGLVEEEAVHALVCCTTRPAAERVAAYAESARVPLLSPAALREGPEAHWAFSLAPTAEVELAAIAGRIAREGGDSAALMSLQNAFGRTALEALEAALAGRGLALAGEARYPPDRAPLTPEALWVATRQPGAVVVWGLPADSRRAVDALRARGWDGPLYAAAALLDPLGGGIDLYAFEGVRFALPPAALGPALPPDHPSYRPALDYLAHMRAVYGAADEWPHGASVYDALELVRLAAEQLLGYGIPLDDVRVVRQALWDALIGLSEVAGAAGAYDPRAGERSAALPSGLALVGARRGRLVPLP